MTKKIVKLCDDCEGEEVSMFCKVCKIDLCEDCALDHCHCDACQCQDDVFFKKDIPSKENKEKKSNAKKV